MDAPKTIEIPDFAVREIGALHIQLTLANQRVAELERELAASVKPAAPSKARAT